MERDRGYLLIEALIALLLAASLLATLITLQLRLAGDGRLAAERGFAAVYAEAGAEALLGDIRAGAALDSEHEDSRQASTPEGEDAGFEYRRRWSLAPGPGLIAAEITVAWPEQDSEPPRRLALTVSAQPSAAAESGQALIGGFPVISP